MTPATPPDQEGPPGTAAERTHLSWTRTTLAIPAGGITIARLLWERSPALGATVLVASLCVAAALVVLTALHERAAAIPGAPGPDGLLLAVVAGGTSALGVAAMVLVVMT